ncbi:MAG: DHH family phosphoesterase [Candidatus Hydrothermarchaeales archaeon]
MYLILGCGTAGYFVAEGLNERRKELLLVDKDHKRVEDLREMGFEVVEGDITDKETLKAAKLSKANTVLILTTDVKLNRSTAELVRKLNPQVPIIVRAGPKSTKNEFSDLDVDVVIYPTSVVADYAINSAMELDVSKKFKKLKQILSEISNGLAIVVHNNPDPDSIASALTLKRIAEGYGKSADIIYGDEIGHEENRALVNLMGIELKHASEVDDFGKYSKIALVDTAIPESNNPLPRNIVPDIVIDHHQINIGEVKAEYIDIRTDTGATSTILAEYAKHLEKELDRELATALLYGIKTDTQDFTRGTTPLDLRAVATLYPAADHDLIAKIEAPPMLLETMDVLGEAIRNRKVKGSYLLSNVGFIRDRDVLPQAADYLLNLEGISTVVVYGIGEGAIHLSARNKDIRINLGKLMEKAFGDIGQAGGHGTAAAAKIPLGLFGGVKDKDALLRLAEDAVTERFLKIVGVKGKKSRP